MLTFLRKIRKSSIGSSSAEALAKEGGSTRKYLLYAIGEIALVVIGILIALQINNWNEYRKDSLLEKEYLTRIKDNIIQDTTFFRDQIIKNLEIRERIKLALSRMYQGFENKEQVIEIMAVYDEALNRVFVSNTSAYVDMLSTGNIRLIKNIDLRDLIVNLYSQYEEKSKLMESDKNWMDGIAINLDSNVNFIKFSKDNIDIFTKTEMIADHEWSFLNNSKSEEFNFVVRAIASTAWNLAVSNGYYLELIESCKETSGAINKQLSNSK